MVKGSQSCGLDSHKDQHTMQEDCKSWKMTSSPIRRNLTKWWNRF